VIAAPATRAPRSSRVGRSVARLARASVAAAAFAVAPSAWSQDAAALLARAAEAARTQNYVGTIVFQTGNATETSRIVHAYDKGEEFEKLVNLDGPAREVIRQKGEVRCYYPDSKTVRVEPRTFRNAFPSLSPQQLTSLGQFYTVRKASATRVAGREAQGWKFVPKDAYRYAHEFWTDAATGMLLKARTLDERGEAVEQFAFLDLTLGAAVDAELAKPTWSGTPADWSERRGKMTGAVAGDTGWTVSKLPPGFAKIMEGTRAPREGRAALVQLVYSDGLIAVSVFIEPRGGERRFVGRARQGGLNQFSVKVDDYVVTALGEAPAETIRQIAQAVVRR